VLSLPEDGSIAGFLNVVLHSKLNNGQIPKKKKKIMLVSYIVSEPSSGP
jgi:hypothetical protein